MHMDKYFHGDFYKKISECRDPVVIEPEYSRSIKGTVSLNIVCILEVYKIR
jgi:hypothetical protein